jgi:protocatechuate 3,4-dioxygenase alpha subunit
MRRRWKAEPVARRRIATPSQTVGPFFGFALPFDGDSNAVPPTKGDALRIEGQVLDGAGEPVPDSLLEVWQGELFARSRTDGEGAFHLTVRKPAALRLSNGRLRAPHLNVAVFARGLLRHLATFIYFPEEIAANEADPVLQLLEPAARETLIAHRDGDILRFDVRLQGEDETAFFAI